MDDNHRKALSPKYQFDETELQPSLFDLDLPSDNVEIYPLTFEEVRRRETVAVSAFQARLREIILMPDEKREESGFSGVPDYYEVFLDLLDEGWPPRIAAFIAWASSPRIGRWPKTQDELAHQLGLTSDRQFTKWRRASPAIDSLISKLQAAPLLKHRADVFDALIRSASTPDYKHQPDRKLLLEITGDYVPSAKFEASMKHSAGNNLVGSREQEIIENLLNPKLDSEAE